jgi:hypothetical protein
MAKKKAVPKAKKPAPKAASAAKKPANVAERQPAAAKKDVFGKIILPAIVVVLVIAALFYFVPPMPQKPLPPPQLPQAPQAPPAMPGSDRDSHGCIGSAGYSWCEQLGMCIRPWETDCESGAKKCKTLDDCGMGAARCDNGLCTQYDEHGCVPDGGYQWCEALQECIRPWETNCTSSIATEARKHCGEGEVFICGNYIKVVSDMPGAGSTFYEYGTAKSYHCPIVAPDYMTPACRQLMLGSNCVDQPVSCPSAPAAITDLKDDPSFVGAQLTWSKPDSTAYQYAIYRGDKDLKQVSLIKITDQTGYNDVFDGKGLEYAYFVRVLNAAGKESASSNIVYVQQLSTASQPSPGQID